MADGLYDAAGELAERGIDPLPLLDRLGTSVLLRRPKTDAVPLVTEDSEDGSVRWGTARGSPMDAQETEPW